MPVFRLLLVWLLSFSGLVSAQELHFNARTFEHDPAILKVKKLYQTRDGFIWLGTSQGLFRYDGFKPTPFYPVNSRKALPPVSALFQDSRQRLWIGCENGKIYVLENRQLHAFKPREATPKESILAIQEDKQGNIWFATYGEGLFCLKNNSFHNFNTTKGLPDDYVYTLTLDQAGNTWAGTDRGIAVCNFNSAGVEIRTLGTAQGLPDNIVTALAICPGKKTIWAGTYSGGFCTINAQTLQVIVPEVSRNWNQGAITSFLPTGATSAMVATLGKGLWDFDTKTPERLAAVSKEPALKNLKITDVLQDKEGLIWLAHNAPEVYQTDPSLRLLPLPVSVNPAGVHALLAARNGDLWFGTDDGLFRATKTLQGYEIKPAFTSQPFRKNKVISLFEDGQGYIWVGTFGGGVFRLQPETGTVKQFTEKNGLVNDNVLSVAGSGKEIWLATLGGASRCRLNQDKEVLVFENFNQEDGIGFNYIYQVFADSKNRIWFATDGKGLTKLEHGRFTNYSGKAGLEAKTIYSIAETKDGNLWVSTSRNGLYRFNGKRFANFGTRQGLRDLNISGLSTDKAGNLLVLHQKGLDVIDPGSGRIRYLGAEAGLQEMGQDLNALAKDASATVWFGTQKGLAVYRPGAATLPFQPRTRLTSVQLFLKPLPKTQTEFAHDENHVTFGYAGLWYQQPEAVRYRVKLQGYDQEWIYTGDRSITYPQLPPGKYRFLVSASATGNFENTKPVSYPFAIEKPFWNQIWFYALALAAGSSLFFGIIKLREKQVKKAERLEKDKVMFQFETLKNQVNPHFLFNSFNTLIGIIEDDQEAAVTYVEKLSDFFRDILVYREKDTITLREELVLIRNYYFLQQKRYGANLRLEVDVPEAEQDLLIAPLTLQLLVENAIKHNVVSRDKPLTIKIFTEPGPTLVVRNNLQKKKIPESSTGIGLANICNRYAILSKRPVLVTENAAIFEVKVPLFFPFAS